MKIFHARFSFWCFHAAHRNSYRYSVYIKRDKFQCFIGVAFRFPCIIFHLNTSHINSGWAVFVTKSAWMNCKCFRRILYTFTLSFNHLTPMHTIHTYTRTYIGQRKPSAFGRVACKTSLDALFCQAIVRQARIWIQSSIKLFVIQSEKFAPVLFFVLFAHLVSAFFPCAKLMQPETDGA